MHAVSPHLLCYGLRMCAFWYHTAIHTWPAVSVILNHTVNVAEHLGYPSLICFLSFNVSFFLWVFFFSVSCIFFLGQHYMDWMDDTWITCHCAFSSTKIPISVYWGLYNSCMARKIPFGFNERDRKRGIEGRRLIWETEKLTA